MRFLIILLAIAARAQDFTASPSTVRQGETIKLHATKAASSARMSGLTVPLFPQSDGLNAGLMPVKIGEKPGLFELEFLDQAGAVLHAAKVTVVDAHYPKQNIVLTQQLTELHATTDEADTVHTFLTQVSPDRFWEEPLHVPVPGCMTSLFGVHRLHNGKATGDYHGGVDQRAALSAPIRAVAAGTVKISRMFTLRGGTIAIDHGQGLETIYMHMSKLEAAEGQHVQPGDIVGYAGSTGRSTAPHLHWSLYVHGQPVNPNQWVKLQPCASPVKKPMPKKEPRP